ncbi:MAG: hypothetical protein U9M90_03930 [Patescibacteria group bacterium]|nr:hypothetical protein [Patescibacteria group bacterium]
MRTALIIFFLVLIVLLLFLGKSQSGQDGIFSLSANNPLVKYAKSVWNFFTDRPVLRSITLFMVVLFGFCAWWHNCTDEGRHIKQAIVRYEQDGPVLVFDLPPGLKYPRIEFCDTVTATVNNDKVIGFRFDGTLYEFRLSGERAINRTINRLFCSGDLRKFHRESNLDAAKFKGQKAEKKTVRLWHGSELEWNKPPYTIEVLTNPRGGNISFPSHSIRYKVVDQKGIGM